MNPTVGDGTSSVHFKKSMLNKGVAYVEAIVTTTLQRGECSIAYGAYYMPSLVYDTPGASLTNNECEDIHRPVVLAILPKMGVVRNTARAVVFRPSQYCGLWLDNLAVVQGHSRIQDLIGHLRSKSLTGKLIRNQLEYTQLKVGCETNCLPL
jgi:hypothetical protein